MARPKQTTTRATAMKIHAASSKTLTISGFFAAAIISAGLLSPVPAEARGLVSFDVGKSNVCIGLASCLFTTKKVRGRNSKNVKDHRKNTTDHRRNRTTDHRKNTEVVVNESVRDHRTQPRGGGVIVRDHRSKVRDHR